MQRRQFPLRLAYSISINKSQGQEFERVGLDVTIPCFAHGHLYVSLSRIRDCKDFLLMNIIYLIIYHSLIMLYMMKLLIALLNKISY